MDTNKIEKLSLLTELIKLARADEEVREEEFRFLMAIAEQLGISADELAVLFKEYIDFQPPAGDFERILQLQRLILLSNVDSQSDQQELSFIRQTAIRMGLNALAIEEVLARMNDYENKVIPPETLIGIFTKNYN